MKLSHFFCIFTDGVHPYQRELSITAWHTHGCSATLPDWSHFTRLLSRLLSIRGDMGDGLLLLSSSVQPMSCQPMIFTLCPPLPRHNVTMSAVCLVCPALCPGVCACVPPPQAYGVVGSSPQGACEVEGVPGVSISLAQLPGVELSLVHTLRSGLPSEGEDKKGLNTFGMGGGGSAGYARGLASKSKYRQAEAQFVWCAGDVHCGVLFG